MKILHRVSETYFTEYNTYELAVVDKIMCWVSLRCLNSYSLESDQGFIHVSPCRYFGKMVHKLFEFMY
jgi:hypothetical protein